eukprot:TRINITY_DN1677_c0_g1_i2.p1 TRINITY_DN1677_c0_g1~~TRINITY_DN1677_c0_g1_i2.p1  ORF type:complete len:102 (+),score=10.49 TRINITY_DN1677_c0_g1_i2:175-480(+)
MNTLTNSQLPPFSSSIYQTDSTKSIHNPYIILCISSHAVSLLSFLQFLVPQRNRPLKALRSLTVWMKWIDIFYAKQNRTRNQQCTYMKFLCMKDLEGELTE